MHFPQIIALLVLLFSFLDHTQLTTYSSFPTSAALLYAYLLSFRMPLVTLYCASLFVCLSPYSHSFPLAFPA